MQDKKFTASDLTMAATQSLEQILNLVKASNLNFQIQQSPFSATISLRRSFIKDKLGNPLIPPPPNTDLFSSLSKDNQTLNEKVYHLEGKYDIIHRNYENALSAAEISYQKISKLEKELKLIFKQNEAVTTFNKKLEDHNARLENEMEEIRDSLENETNQRTKLEEVVSDAQTDLKKSKKYVKQLTKRNETLESESKNLTAMINAKDDEIEKFKAKSVEPGLENPSTESKATNTPCILYSTTSTQSLPNSIPPIISKDLANNKVMDKCTHSSGCFIRQPKTPPYFPSPKCSYNPPPSNIRLLPFSVSTYQDFRNLHSSHECEECTVGSLFHNYHEIVQYPDPGPCGGTSGSRVKSCSNNQNSKITIMNIRCEEKVENEHQV